MQKQNGQLFTKSALGGHHVVAQSQNRVRWIRLLILYPEKNFGVHRSIGRWLHDVEIHEKNVHEIFEQAFNNADVFHQNRRKESVFKSEALKKEMIWQEKNQLDLKTVHGRCEMKKLLKRRKIITFWGDIQSPIEILVFFLFLIISE